MVGTLDKVAQALRDNAELLEMARDEDDEHTLEAVADDLVGVEKSVADLEFRRMFSHPNFAIVDDGSP